MLIRPWYRRYVRPATIIVIIQLGFIVAKLTGLLAWPFSWVFSPFILTGIILVAVIIAAAFIVLLTG